MQKSRLGIPASMLAVFMFLLGLFDTGFSFAILVILALYVLLVERSVILKKSAVKAVVISVLFTFIGLLMNFVPTILGLVNDVVGIFGKNIDFSIVDHIVNIGFTGLGFLRFIVFVVFIVFAILKKSLPIPFLEKALNRGFAKKENRQPEHEEV